MDINKQGNKLQLYFSLLYFINMAARSLFSPFMTVYLQEKGLSTQHIGAVMAVNSLVIILSQPFWGMVADRIQSTRKTLVCCFVFQGLVFFSYNLLTSALLVAVTFVLGSFFSSPEGPLLDTLTLRALKARGNDKGLGRVKLWGCIGFSAFSVVSGWIVNRYTTRATIPVFAVLLILIGAFVWRFNTGEDATPGGIRFQDLRVGRLFTDRSLLLFLGYVFLMQIPHRAAYTFYPVLIESLSGSKSMVGYTTAIMFVSEAVIMYFSKNLLKRVRPVYLIMASSLFFALWQFLYSGMTDAWQVVAAAALDGPAFGLLTIGVLYYIDEIAPPELRSTYQTLSYGVYFGLSGVAGNALGGWVVPNLGFRTMYLAGGAMILVTTAGYLLVQRGRRTGRPVAERK